MIHNTSLTGKNTTEDPRQQHIPSLILEGLKTCVQTADAFVGCRMVAGFPEEGLYFRDPQYLP